MEKQQNLLDSIDRLHTTDLGKIRIRENLKLDLEDPMESCRQIIQRPDCTVSRKGKNWYCESENIRITIHARSFTIITARRIR